MSKTPAAMEAALKGIQADMKADGFYHGAIDGDFGPGSKGAWLTMRQRAAAAGIVTAPTVPPIMQPAAKVSAALTEKDYADGAALLGCSVTQVKAIFEVEAMGSGWFTDVRADILARDGPGGFLDGPDLPKILFEAHIFDRETGGKFRASHPKLSSAKWNRSLYVGGQGEYIRLDEAMKLDRRAALRSASWGAAQIMGYNHKLAGFDTVEAFVDAMKTGSRAHLMAFVSFVKESNLTAAVRKIDGNPENARAFAAGYNGKSYAANRYDVRIAEAFVRYR